MGILSLYCLASRSFLFFPFLPLPFADITRELFHQLAHRFISLPGASPGLFQSRGLSGFLLGKDAHQLTMAQTVPSQCRSLSSLLGSESENGLLLCPHENCWLAPSQRYLEEMAEMLVSLNCNHQLVLKGLLKGSKWRGQCCSVCQNPGCFDGWYWVRVLTGSCSVARLNEGSS